MEFLKLYAIAVPIFFAIDIAWLTLVARNFYRDQLGELFTANVNWPAALLFYAIFIVGIVVFAVLPARDEGSLARALGLGALLGLVAYSTYDLTNLATTKNWPFALTVIDIAWGTALACAVSGLTYLAARELGI